MNLDYLYEKLRRRAPTSFDLDAVAARYRARNEALVSDWRERFPGTDSAVLEITVRARGHTRRRLRRYRELGHARIGTPGVLLLSELTSFNDILDFRIIEIAAAAARADVDDIEWRFLTVAEALEPTP